jgi:hypothetical protein
MKINEFVANAIIEICEGIEKAKSSKINNNGAVAPYQIIAPAGNKREIFKVREIEFDLNVVITKENTLDIGGGGNVGIKMFGGVETSANKSLSSTQQETQRIKFSVPFLAESICPDGKC